MGFRKLINESLEDVATVADITELLEKLDLDASQLSEIAEEILESYVLFDDELEFIDDEMDGSYDFDHDDLKENEIVVEEDEELDEAFNKVGKGERMQNRRASKKMRRKASVKKDLKARSKKKCSGNQRTMKVAKGVYKCVAKDAASRKRGKRMKKFKKLYKNG